MFDWDDEVCGTYQAVAEPKGASTAKLVDNSFDLGLEAVNLQIGVVGAVAWRRADGAARAPLAVVLVPGNPEINSYHSSMDLPLALEKEFLNSGIPVVRFDYDGVGLSSPGSGNPPSSGYHVTVPNTRAVIEWAKEHLSDRIVACGWNYGGSPATILAHERMPGLHALMFVSWGYNIWMMVKQMESPEAGLALREEYEGHAKLELPAIYIFGDKDSFTPSGHVQRIVKSRSDRGARAEVRLIKQGDQPRMENIAYFQLRGKEKETAGICVNWVKGLWEELQAQDSKLIGA